jgi:hypothetical protein
MCEFQFFRTRIVPDDGAALTNAEECRKVVALRNATCHRECDTCKGYCSSSLARGLKDAVECSVNLPVFSIWSASVLSDAGQQIAYHHGADRRTGRKPIPEDTWLEQFDILINQDVARPKINRNAVSCRREHREDATGDFTEPLTGTGKPRKRSGYMVPCATDTDCFTACGLHPDTGLQYRCTRSPTFYSFHVINGSLTEETLALALASQSTSLPVTTDVESQEYKLSVLESRPKWIPMPDTVKTKAYYVDEPGDDVFDPPPGSLGVCTDVAYQYQHTNCQSRAGAAAIVGLAFCPLKLATNLAFCGAQIERIGPDFLASSISARSLEFPRVLTVPGSVHDKAHGALTCADPLECSDKCGRLARTSRNGLDIPPGCALCDSICPSNGATSLFDTIEAVSVDIANAVRVLTKCLSNGPVGCICNILMVLKPAWIDILPTPQERCAGGNIFGLLANKILEMYARRVLNLCDRLVVSLNPMASPRSQDDAGRRGCSQRFHRGPDQLCSQPAPMAPLLPRQNFAACLLHRILEARGQVLGRRRVVGGLPGLLCNRECACQPAMLLHAPARDLHVGRRLALRALQRPVRGAQRRRARGAVPQHRRRLLPSGRSDLCRPLRLDRPVDARRRRAGSQADLRQQHL